jgi:hypothetical protein
MKITSNKSTKIEAGGLLSGISGILKQAAGIVDTLFKNLANESDDFEVIEEKLVSNKESKGKGEHTKYHIRYNGAEFYFSLFEGNGEQFNILFTTEKRGEVPLNNIKQSQLERRVKKEMDRIAAEGDSAIQTNTNLDINDNPIDDQDIAEGLSGILDKISGMMESFFDNDGISDIKSGIKYRAQFNGIFADINISHAQDSGFNIEVKASTGDILSLDILSEDEILSTVESMLWQVFTGQAMSQDLEIDEPELESVDDSDIGEGENYLDEGDEEIIEDINDVEDIDVDSSKKLAVTLQRVVSSKEESIELVAINANYGSKDMMRTLDVILANDELLDMITEEPVTLMVTDELDSFDVEPIANEDAGIMNLCDNIHALMAAANTFVCNIIMLHWNAKGDKFSTIHNQTDSWRYQSGWDLDLFGELASELCGSAPNPGVCINTDMLIPSGMEFAEEEIYPAIFYQMDTYIRILEMYYVNFDHDIQSSLDNIIRYWRKERDFNVSRTIKR